LHASARKISANKDLAKRIENLKAGHGQTASIINVLGEIDGIARELRI